MKSLHRLTLTLAVALIFASMAASQTTECRPTINCMAPNCRCWDDPNIPGGLTAQNTPQVVMVTFEYSVNIANVDQYREIFGETKNPNACPAVGTFFVQQTGTDMSLVKELRDAGHEIGVTSIDGTSPETGQQWNSELNTMKSALTGVGIPAADILGFRAPELRPGGIDQFNALASQGFLYDASCTTSRFDGYDGQLLWPYTYDFAPGPTCDFGEGPTSKYPGRWQILVTDLEFNGTKCASPQACTQVASERDAFDLFYNSFIKHYEGTRSPFLMIINPDWALTDFKREGTRQFIEYIRSAFEDTWVLSAKQALDWIRNPVPNADTNTYQPWAC